MFMTLTLFHEHLIQTNKLKKSFLQFFPSRFCDSIFFSIEIMHVHCTSTSLAFACHSEISSNTTKSTKLSTSFEGWSVAIVTTPISTWIIFYTSSTTDVFDNRHVKFIVEFWTIKLNNKRYLQNHFIFDLKIIEVCFIQINKYRNIV